MLPGNNKTMIEADRISWTGSRKFRRNLTSPTHNFQVFQIYGNGVITQPRRQARKRERKPYVSTSVSQRDSNKILTALKDYCIDSTLHGLRYIGSTSLSIGERLFWLLAFSIAVGASGWFILNVYEKWQSNPVIMSYGPYDSKLSELPFPAITICSLNRAKRDVAEQIANESDERGKRILDRVLTDLCLLGGDARDKYDSYGFSWSDIEPTLNKVAITCEDILKQCTWSNENVDCKVLFTPVLTDDGMCCFFNRLPNKLIYRKQYSQRLAINDSFLYPEKDAYDWTPQRGYLDDENDDNMIPRRSSGPGLKKGLTLILDAHLDNYYCSSAGSAGFKVLMSSPSDTPRIGEYAHLLNPGVEVRVSIRPVITEARESLKNVPIATRRCYFEGEKVLKYYRHYSKSNCHLECESNKSLESCQCAPHFMPKSPDEKFCVHKNFVCTDKVRKTLSKHDTCHCLRSCYENFYITTKSFGKLLPNSIPKQINIPEGSSVESTTIVHFFFTKSSYNKLFKSELFAFTDIVSNIGGLLGLFMGFSVMSIVEIIYFLSLRLWCTYHKERIIENSRKTSINQDYRHISKK